MKLDAWLERFFDVYYRRHPVNATFIGVHDYDDQLPDYSRNAIVDAVGEISTLLEALDAIEDEPSTRAQAIDRELAEGFLRIQLWEYGASHFQMGNPSHYVGEAVFGPLSLFLREARPLQERLDAAWARLEQVPGFLDQARENISAAPLEWIEKAIEECQGGIAFASEGVPAYLALHGVEHPRLVEAARSAAEAFASYRDYLRAELLPCATNGYAAGPEALDAIIKRAHCLPLDAQQIAERARATMEDCRVALERGAAQFGAPDWGTALAQLADDHPPAAEYETAYDETWRAAREFAVERGLISWPVYPIRFVPRPAWVRSAAPHLYFLFYRAPSAFDPVEVVDYLIEPLPEGGSEAEVERVLRAHNRSVIKLNHVIHHGGLGHHLQNWHAYRAESRIGRIAAVDCASRIAMLCGGTMAEGWACYATDLMDEAGFLAPLESFSMIYSRLRMAARAVADVGLHSGRMALPEVIALYRDEVGMPEAAARAEAVKNSMHPGGALMYLTGTDQIHALRRRVVDDQGLMGLRDFHDRFLTFGSIPVSLAARALLAEVGEDA